MKKLLNSNTLFIALLIFLSLGNYIFSLRTDNYFSTDDFFVLAYLKDNNLFQMIFEFLTKGDIFGFRKIMGYIFFGILFKTFGTNALIFNVFIFLIHTANLMLLYLITVYLSKNKLSAFIVSLIFNKYYLFYFSNLHEYSLVLFSLLTIYLFLEFPKKTYLYLTSFVFALLSKETAFSTPFVLYALSLIKKTKRDEIKRIYPMFVISFLFIVYQFYSLLTGSTLNVNSSYLLVDNFGEFVKNLLFYLDWKIIVFSLLLPIMTKKYRYSLLFLVVLITLIPASILQNRKELYYLYLPMSYLLIYISLFLSKTNYKTVVLYIILIVVFGGRSILPKIAWQKFPNWQKISMENVVRKVEGSLNTEKSIYIGDIYLERDARLMLESKTFDLFINKKFREKYSFIYDANSDKMEVVPK